ncbi:MAG: PP2C family protein-serine/threonine phosphatase [Planctomycetota bacterium]
MSNSNQQPSEPTDDASVVEQLIRDNLGALVAVCRAKTLERPELESLVRSLHIDKSDDWVRQAISLFTICIKHYSGPAAEWHDEVGELNFTAGLSMADANAFLGILRNAALQLVWDTIERGSLPRERQSTMVRAVLRAYDHAVALQAEAYVRESQKHLTMVNRQLETQKKIFARDLALAELVQQKFVPKEFRSKSFQAEVRYVPTTGIGGDHAGIFPVSEDLIYVNIYDVTGHGIASALVAEIVNSQLRTLLHRKVDTLFQYPVEPVDVVRELNALVHDEFQPLGMLITCFVALIDASAETITYSGAGHPPAILQCCSAHNIIELRSQNIILGAVEECVLDEGQNTVPLHRGDRIIFYTDGIMEANDGAGDMLGINGLKKIIEQHYKSGSSELADKILAIARRTYGSNENDDMSLILLDILMEQSCCDEIV